MLITLLITMGKLGQAYEHDQLIKFLDLIQIYFLSSEELSVKHMDQLESAIIELLKFLMEVYEEI